MARRTLVAFVGGAAALALALSACGGGNIKSSSSGASGSGGKACGTLNIAVNNWVGIAADSYVVGEIAKTKLGCTVNYQTLDEQPSWQAEDAGTTDVIMENWGHDDLAAKYIKKDGGSGSVTDLGATGNIGKIGWFVPPWMVKKYPDITDWKNLNKYASMFKTSESGSKGQFLDGDPSYVTNDEALVKNLKLDYKVVFAGSEDALITTYRQAEQKKTPVIGYWYTPQWFNSEVPMVNVKLPKYTNGCDKDAAKVACDYPTYNLNKIARTGWVDSGSPSVNLVKNFHWTNDDQDLVASYIAKDKMSDTAAADKWIAANPDKVAAWLK